MVEGMKTLAPFSSSLSDIRSMFFLLCLQGPMPGALMSTAAGSVMEKELPHPSLLSLDTDARWFGIAASSFLPHWLICSDALSISSSQSCLITV